MPRFFFPLRAETPELLPTLSRVQVARFLIDEHAGETSRGRRKRRARKVETSWAPRGLVKLRITSLIIIVRGSNAATFSSFARGLMKQGARRGGKKKPLWIITRALSAYSTEAGVAKHRYYLSAFSGKIKIIIFHLPLPMK